MELDLVKTIKDGLFSASTAISDRLIVGTIKLERALDHFIVQDPLIDLKERLQQLVQDEHSHHNAVGLLNSIDALTQTTPQEKIVTTWNGWVKSTQEFLRFNVTQPLFAYSLQLHHPKKIASPQLIPTQGNVEQKAIFL
ncbi:MAG: hypothetical protein COV45_06910 [Deltaproteobacteria bacterium CG11_big_fil_rev_8_21_14_0_20_47_16]|nr:MAG: hypothetical protein COV45_06910 [Deltaproteobacteria bacterium CG11_big_fil_rev_8_21_14_0_20_47_16]